MQSLRKRCHVPVLTTLDLQVVKNVPLTLVGFASRGPESNSCVICRIASRLLPTSWRSLPCEVSFIGSYNIGLPVNYLDTL